MSRLVGYCPECDGPLTETLLPLDYYRCKSCMSSVHVDDIIHRRGFSLLESGGGGPLTTPIIVVPGQTASARAAIVAASFPTPRPGDLALIAVAGHGYDSLPVMSSSNIVNFTLIDSYHSNNQHQVALYRAPFVVSYNATTVAASWYGNGACSISTMILRNVSQDNPVETSANHNGNGNGYHVTIPAAGSTRARLAIGVAMCNAEDTEIGQPYDFFDIIASNAGIDTTQTNPPNVSLMVAKRDYPQATNLLFMGPVVPATNVKWATVGALFNPA